MRHIRPERTDPYFVKMNGRTTNVWHDHELFGKPRTVRRPVHDKNGRQLYERRVVSRRIGDILEPFTSNPCWCSR